MSADDVKMDIIQLLIDHRADVNARNGEPLEDAKKNNKAEIINLLVSAGAHDK